jgi:PAS domain S-box-containing protein
MNAAGADPEEGAEGTAGREAHRDSATAAARLALELARAQEGRMAFLARASVAMGTSLDSSTTADHIARLAVPDLADVCIIDLGPPDQHVYRTAALAEGLGGAPRAARLLADARAPLAGSPQAEALRTGRAQIGVLTPQSGELPWPAGSAELRHLQELDIRSYLVLPLRSRGQTVGLVTLLSARARGYAADEFATAGEFVARASTAVDNALLYEEAVRARAGAEAARKQTEVLIEGLRISEERYRTLFEESRDAIYMTSRDGRFVDANPAALELFGYTRDELMSVNASELYLQPDQRRDFSKVIEAKGSVRDFEVTLRRSNGELLDCLLSSMARRDVDGNIIGYQGIIHDITERKRAERRAIAIGALHPHDHQQRAAGHHRLRPRRCATRSGTASWRS